MGTPLNVAKRSPGGYTLAGITEVGEHIPIRKLLDRGWPDYAYPRPLEADSMVVNYRRFMAWQQQHRGMQVERFQAGRSDQIVPLAPGRASARYPYQVLNIAVNGEIGTGPGKPNQMLFPPLRALKPADYPNENMCSAALLIRYGAFDYFTGGDIQGVLPYGAPAWHDVETPIAREMDPVDVQLVNHHGYPDAQNGTLLARLRPRVLILPAWHASHPDRTVLERIFSTESYPGERDVFATNLLPEAKKNLTDLLPKLKSEAGHVVIRVDPGGKRYRVLVVDDQTESFTVKAVYGPYKSR